MDGECLLERGLWMGSVLRNFNRREEQEDSDEGQLWYTKTELAGPKGYSCEATACLALDGDGVSPTQTKSQYVKRT